MDLLERLRPRWRHADPEVRAAAVREMDAGDQARLESIAASDPDARVRRIALKKLDDADRIEAVAQAESDEDLRAFAAERAREVRAAAAASDGPLAACQAALARLADERSLATVAAVAAHEAVRSAALARVTSNRLLRDVVRSAKDAAIQDAALARIDDPALLRSVAVGDARAELALQAVERISDAPTLQAIAENRGATKAVRQRAQALLVAVGGGRVPIGTKEGRARQLELCLAVENLLAARDLLAAAEQAHAAQGEWATIARDVEPRDDVARRFAKACTQILDEASSHARRCAEVEAVVTAADENLTARTRLCERVERLDEFAPDSALDEAVAAWQRLPPLADERMAGFERRFQLARERATAARGRRVGRESVHARLEAVVGEAETMAVATPLPNEGAWRALHKRWTALAASAADVPDLVDLRQRVEAAGDQLAGRRRDADARRADVQRNNLARLEALCTRARELAAAESVDLKVARRECKAAEAAVADLGPLPPSEERAAWTQRVTEARDELMRRLRQAEETEEWRRWANVSAQEEIIRRVEALLEANDMVEGTRQLAKVQEEWAAVASATADKAQGLWERFKTARNELRKRCDAYLAENLEKKRALVAQVAAIGESTAWNETTDLVKRLQTEWKEIGPVPHRHTRAIWQEFRGPCEAFFARRKQHFAKRDAERDSAAAAKTTLCERAEALADSTDWDATTRAMKQLQADWKQSPPLARAQGDALWRRFRAACDRFFDRSRRRDELEQEAQLEEGRAICARLDAVAASLGGEGAPSAEEAGKALDEAWGTWLRLELGPADGAKEIAGRLSETCRRIAEAQPECLRGTRLDPAVTGPRREKLCARLEKLVEAAPEAPKPQSLQEMALALRERLAANTIGGGAAPSNRDTTREVGKLRASWELLGPPLDDEARVLGERFDRAVARAQTK